MSTAPLVRPNPNAQLLAYRKLHTWFGLSAGVFLVMIAATGIYLNHKGFFESLLGFQKPDAKKPEAKPHEGYAEPAPGGRPGAGRPLTEFLALTISLPAALEKASTHLGARPIERVEMKAEHGRVVYKVKAVGGPEVVVDADTGALTVKGERQPGVHDPKPEHGQPGDRDNGTKPPPKEPKSQARTEAPDAPDRAAGQATQSPGSAQGGINWSKAIKDLHTGKIGGDAGKLLVDLVAVGIILLTLTGLYMWAVPELRKRRSARQRAAAEAARNANTLSA